MRRFNRFVSALVLAAFILNTALTDTAFGLATASRLDDLNGIEYKDIGRIKISLMLYLRAVKAPGIDFNGIESTIYQPADMQFFFSEGRKIGDWVSVRCKLKDKYGTRIYYACYPQSRDAQRGYPIEIYTAKEWALVEETFLAGERLPSRKPEDDAVISRYINQEKGLDAVIAYAWKIGVVKELPKPGGANGFDYKEFTAKLLEDCRINVTNPEGLTDIGDRKVYLIDAANEKGDLPLLLSQEEAMVKVVDVMGVEHEFRYSAHSSNNAVHLFIYDSAFFGFLTGGKLARRNIAADTKEDAMAYLRNRLIHEIGVMLGLPILRVEEGMPKNELDLRYEEFSRKGQKILLNTALDARVVNLDHLKGVNVQGRRHERDYADGRGGSPLGRGSVTNATMPAPAEGTPEIMANGNVSVPAITNILDAIARGEPKAAYEAMLDILRMMESSRWRGKAIKVLRRSLAALPVAISDVKEGDVVMCVEKNTGDMGSINALPAYTRGNSALVAQTKAEKAYDWMIAGTVDGYYTEEGGRWVKTEKGKGAAIGVRVGTITYHIKYEAIYRLATSEAMLPLRKLYEVKREPIPGFADPSNVASFYDWLKTGDYRACLLYLKKALSKFGLSLDGLSKLFLSKYLPFLLANTAPIHIKRLEDALLKDTALSSLERDMCSVDQDLAEHELLDKNPISRLTAIGTLKRLMDQGRLVSAPLSRENNVHVHSRFSYSPYYPAEIAYWAKRAGLRNIGIIDHDTVDGIGEFLTACQRLGIKSTSGFEMRVNMGGTAFAGKVLNAPGVPDMVYFICHALPYANYASISMLLNNVRRAKDIRNRRMMVAVDGKLKSLNIDISIDYDVDVQTLSENGNCTDRHLMTALANKIRKSALDRRKTYEAILGGIKDARVLKAIESDDTDTLAELLRGVFLKPDSPRPELGCFIPPDNMECPNIKETVDAIKSAGGIPVYPYLGQSAKNKTVEEAVLKDLFAYLKKIGVMGIAIMPHRNSEEEIAKVIALAKEHGLKVFSGVDINRADMPFIQEKARVSQYPEFMAGGDFLVGHELMSRHTGYGYYSPEMVKLIPNEEERFRFFASIGAKSYEELCRIAAPHQMPRNMLMYVSGLADKFLETEKSKDTPSMTAKDALVVLNVADITCKDWFTLDDHMIKHRAWAIRIGHPDPNFTLSISESRARSNLNSLVERGLLICDDSSEPYRYRLTRRGKSAARRAAIDAIAKHADSVIHKAHTNLAELGRQRLAVEAAMDDRAYLPAYLGKHMSRVKPGKNPENALRVIELSNLYNARSFTLEEYIENYRIVVRENPLLGFDKDISKSAARADLKALAVRGLLNITKRKGAYVYAITHDGIRSLANLIPHINTHVEVLESVLRNVHELPNSDIINIFGALLLAGHNLDEQLKALNDMLKWQKDVLEPLDILSIAAVKLAAGYKREEQIRIMEEWLKDEALGYREELKIRVALLEAGHRKEAQIRAINRVLREEGEGLSSHDRITVHGAFLLAGYRRTANIEVLDKMLSAKLSSREHARVRAAFLAARYQTHEQLDKLVQTLRWHHSAINPSEAIEIRYALIRHYVRERALISKGVELLGAEKRGVLTVYAAVLSAQTPSEPDIEVMMRDYEVRKESNARFHILDAAKIGWYLVRKTEGWTRELDESGSGGITPSIIAHRNPIREGDKAVAEFEDARLKIRTAAIDAKDVGANAIPTHVNDRYTLIVDNNLYADGEMKADIAGYDVDGRHIGAADRFNLVAADTSNVANIIAQIQDPSKTVVQLSGGLKKDDVKRLLAAKPGLRVVNVDTKGFKYDSTINKKLRWCFRFDLYAMMLAARRITEEDLKSKNTAIYRTLKFFLNTHFGDGNENIADEYIKAILNQTEEDIILIIKRALSYVPTGKWRIFEYHSVAATLITEQYL